MIELNLEGPNLNALGTPLMTRLRDGLAAAAGAPLLLRGVGRAFSAGLDLQELITLDRAGMRAFLTLLAELCLDLYTYPGPTVALVNGHAIAGGCILALCCDARVADPDPRLRIGLNEVALGVRFPAGILEIVRRRVAAHRLDEIILGAQLYTAADAIALGMLDALGDESAARARLEALARAPAAAYAAAKHDLRGDVRARARADLPRFLDEGVDLWTAPDLRARVAAVLGKRGGAT